MESTGRRFELLATLGTGGFGTVYRAAAVGEGGFRKIVALKALKPEMVDAPEVAARLRDEARILALLRHRAVAHVDDLLMLGGNWTVVMEYIEGADLSAVAADGPMPLRPALEIAAEIAGVLHAAYTTPGQSGEPLRILHRDLKPANIIVTASGGVKVLDFGIARADFDGREARTQSIGYGSPEYMAPERLGWENGPESDIYSLGCVLFELLTGARFGRAAIQLQRHQEKVEESATKLRALQLPEDAITLLSRMLAYEADKRPTARELETLCDGLITLVREPRLRDWTEANVPRLRAVRPELPLPENTDRVLFESSQARPIPRPATRDNKGLILVAVTLFSGFILLFGSMVFFLILPNNHSRGPVEPPDVGPPTAAAAPTPPPNQPPPAQGPAEAQPAEAGAAPTTSEKEVNIKKEAKATSQQPAQPVATPATGDVHLSGDEATVVLEREGQRVTLPASVAPGSWSITVTFPDRDPISSGKLNVAAGRTHTLNCSATFKRCSAN